MIDYAIFCQSIEDWRAGRRPSMHIATPSPASYEPVDSGVVEMEDMEVDVDESGYGSEEGAPAEQMGPTGTPPAYTTDTPPPYDAGQPAPYTEMISTDDNESDNDGY